MDLEKEETVAPVAEPEPVVEPTPTAEPAPEDLPSPEVDSVVIKLDILKEPPVSLINKSKFFALVKAAFSQRRKTINNSLSSGGYDKEKVKEVLAKLNLDPKLRAEDLSIQDFANISNELEK